MTDITELAQILKAAAIDAKELAIIARYSKGRAAAEKFYALANPANILALVEALEKSEKTSEARREAIDITHKRAARERDRANAAVEALEKAQGMEAYWKTQCRGITDHCEELQARIAELEFRTVKLPKRFCPEEYEGSLLWSETEVWNQAISACNGALRTAGIKVEDE